MGRPATPVWWSATPALMLAAVLLGLCAGVPHAAKDRATPQTPTFRYVAGRHGSLETRTSATWAGYVASGRSYSSVSGTWRLPAVACAGGETSYSSFWVGLDGAGSDTVEQVGADSDCSGGAPTYYAWIEMYPSDAVNLSQPVAPGDALTASVSALGDGEFRLRLRDATQGWSYATVQSLGGAQRASAEWVVEAPMDSGQALPLSDFGQVTFADCQADGQPIDAGPDVTEILGISAAGAVRAQPSDVGSGGRAFTIMWQGG